MQILRILKILKAMSNNGETSFAQTQHTEQNHAARPDATSVQVSAKMGIDFYCKYLGFLTPLHNMHKWEQTVMANLLLRREEISRSCPDPDMVDEILFSTTERMTVCQRCGKSMQAFRQALTSLRKLGAIKEGNKILPRLIPRFRSGSGRYLLTVDFWLYAGNGN